MYAAADELLQALIIFGAHHPLCYCVAHGKYSTPDDCDCGLDAVLRCELCLTEPRLAVPLRYAALMVFHAVIDHKWPIERVERLHRMVPRSGEAFWGLGSLRRKEGYLAFWRVLKK